MNLRRTAAHLRTQDADVLIVCAGWKGNYNLEDALYAGALVEALSESHTPACDSSLAMKTLYAAVKEDLKGFLAQAPMPSACRTTESKEISTFVWSSTATKS
ncbi:2-phosphosulfolactate phosphatase [Nitritalea halalkaliphila LW7]|uniref:Probable 2-phosphosulfolactate phosphatase n=1 Tax=Nitritalea halalkaliphila LW7 TaxID=1189621 RepID=I5C517_9BACT|nr:2-phosphosulfolactate phosphatase [Nitritalea halalkaliphila LW7]